MFTCPNCDEPIEIYTCEKCGYIERRGPVGF